MAKRGMKWGRQEDYCYDCGRKETYREWFNRLRVEWPQRNLERPEPGAFALVIERSLLEEFRPHATALLHDFRNLIEKPK